MKLTRRLLGPVVVGGVGLVAAVPALAGPAAQQLGVARGVYALAGTPHLWISDDQGTLHWGGDTRALSGRAIN
ncbi:MAG TPA: hypothetical protein VNM48_09390 [Chloroflexota bacterium]|nr:hypothetical protein [Chloroflexota bacterium]